MTFVFRWNFVLKLLFAYIDCVSVMHPRFSGANDCHIECIWLSKFAARGCTNWEFFRKNRLRYVPSSENSSTPSKVRTNRKERLWIYKIVFTEVFIRLIWIRYFGTCYRYGTESHLNTLPQQPLNQIFYPGTCQPYYYRQDYYTAPLSHHPSTLSQPTSEYTYHQHPGSMWTMLSTQVF